MPWRKLLLLNLPSLTRFFFHVAVDWRSYASCPAIARSLLWKTVDLPILLESEPLHDHVARILSGKNANRSNCILRFVTSKENTNKTIKESSRKSPYLDRYLWQADNTWIWRQFTLDCQVLPIYISAMTFCVKKLYANNLLKKYHLLRFYVLLHGWSNYILHDSAIGWSI